MRLRAWLAPGFPVLILGLAVIIAGWSVQLANQLEVTYELWAHRSAVAPDGTFAVRAVVWRADEDGEIVPHADIRWTQHGQTHRATADASGVVVLRVLASDEPITLEVGDARVVLPRGGVIRETRTRNGAFRVQANGEQRGLHLSFRGGACVDGGRCEIALDARACQTCGVLTGRAALAATNAQAPLDGEYRSCSVVAPQQVYCTLEIDRLHERLWPEWLWLDMLASDGQHAPKPYRLRVAYATPHWTEAPELMNPAMGQSGIVVNAFLGGQWVASERWDGPVAVDVIRSRFGFLRQRGHLQVQPNVLSEDNQWIWHQPWATSAADLWQSARQDDSCAVLPAWVSSRPRSEVTLARRKRWVLGLAWTAVGLGVLTCLVWVAVQMRQAHLRADALRREAQAMDVRVVETKRWVSVLVFLAVLALIVSAFAMVMVQRVEPPPF